MANYNVKRLQNEIQTIRRDTERRITGIENEYDQKMRQLKEQYAATQREAANELAEVRRRQQEYRLEMERAVREIEQQYEQQVKAKNEELQAAMAQLRQERERILREEKQQSEANRQEAESRLSEARLLCDALSKRPHDRFMPGQLGAVNSAVDQAQRLLNAGLTAAAAGVAGSTCLEMELLSLQLDEEIARFMRESGYVKREVNGMCDSVQQYLARNDMDRDILAEEDFTEGALHAACGEMDQLKVMTDRIDTQGEHALNDVSIPIGVDLTDLYRKAGKKHQQLDTLLDCSERERLSAIHRQSIGTVIAGALEDWGYQLQAKGFRQGKVLLPYVVSAGFTGIAIRFSAEAMRENGTVIGDRLVITVDQAPYLDENGITALADAWRERLLQMLGGRVSIIIGNPGIHENGCQKTIGCMGAESKAHVTTEGGM